MPDTVRVRCESCGTYSEIMTPSPDHEGPVIWKCPHVTNSPDGELVTCGHTNSRET